jgi:hypothetical protein
MKKVVCLIALLFVGATVVNAQEMAMPMIPGNMVNGTTDSASIPNVTAFRIWLDANLPINLWPSIKLTSVDDGRILMDAAKTYHAQYAKLEAAHNAKTTELTSFVWPNADLYALVAGLWTNVQNNMSATGLNQFTNYLQAEKGKMQVSFYDASIDTAGRHLAETRMVASAAGLPQGQQMVPNYSLYTSRTPEIGASQYQFLPGDLPNENLPSPWGIVSGTLGISNGKIVVMNPGSTGTAIAYYNLPPRNSDEQVVAILGALPSTGQSIGIYAMLNASPLNFYRAVWYNYDGTSYAVVLQKSNNGVLTTFGYYWYPMQSGDSMQLTTSLGQAQVYVNGVSVLAAQDASITFAGAMGIGGTANSGSVTYWTEASGYALYSNVQMSGNTICPCPGGALHTGHVNNKLDIGSQGGTAYSATVPPQNSMSAQAIYNFDLPGFDTGLFGPGILTLDGGVLCSLVGLIWQTDLLGNPPIATGEMIINTAITMSRSVGYVPPDVYTLTNFCSPKTTPPDATPIWTDQAFFNPFWKSSNECERSKKAAAGSKWTCQDFTLATIPKVNGQDGLPYQVFDCTVYDKNIKGVYP